MPRASRRAPILVILATALTVAASAVVAVAFFAGGSGTEQTRVAVFPVEGKLIVGGIPAANARVAFHPLGEGRSVAAGITRADGTYRLMTYAPDDGAPAGEYAVTVIWPNEAIPLDECDCPDPRLHDRLFGFYADRITTQLRATVRPERNEIALHAAVGNTGWNLPRLRDMAEGQSGARNKPQAKQPPRDPDIEERLRKYTKADRE